MADGDRFFVPEGLHIFGQQDKTTIGEWLQKPERAASRQEVAGFVESIVQHRVIDLIASAIRSHDQALEQLIQARITSTFGDLLDLHLAQRADARWYWILWRLVGGRGALERFVEKLQRTAEPNVGGPTTPTEPAH